MSFPVRCETSLTNVQHKVYWNAFQTTELFNLNKKGTFIGQCILNYDHMHSTCIYSAHFLGTWEFQRELKLQIRLSDFGAMRLSLQGFEQVQWFLQFPKQNIRVLTVFIKSAASSQLINLMPYVIANHYHYLATIFMAESSLLMSFAVNLWSTLKRLITVINLTTLAIAANDFITPWNEIDHF